MKEVRHIKRTVCGGIILIVAAILLIANGANASATGYFYSGSYGDGGTSVLPKDYNDKIDDGTTGNIAIPLSVKNVATFMEFLKYKNGIRGQERTGSAYIVCTMLGQDFSGCKSNGYISIDQIISSIGYYELESRLNSTDLTIDWNINFAQETLSSFTNTLYDTNTADIYRWLQPDAETFHLIYFRQKGVLLYRLARDCANPIGSLLELPKPLSPWSVQGYSSVESLGNYYPTGYSTDINTYPGDTLHFSHRLDVTKGNAAVTNWVIRRNDGTVLQNDNNVLRTGTGTIVSANDSGGTGGGNSSYMTRSVTQSDVGGVKLCQRIEWVPTSSSNGNQSESTYACANFPYNFSLSATTSISTSNQDPGQSITFQHRLVNNGVTKTNRDVSYSTGVVRFSSDISGQVTNMGGNVRQSESYGNITASSTGNDDGTAKVFKNFNSTSYKISQDDVNNWICGYIAATPHSLGDGSATYGYSCKYIPYNYILTPGVTTNIASDVIEPSSSFSIIPSVVNAGPTKSKDTQWQLTQIVVNPGSNIPNLSGGNSAVNPCGTFFRGPGANCSTVEKGASVFDKGGSVLSGDALSSYSGVASDYEAGTKICFALSLSPRSSSDSQWVHSAPLCLVVGKKPKVQIWGGDLWVGKSVDTSTSVKSSNTFGSWDEYGIFATGSISGMASGAAFAGSGLANSNVCGYSTLSFTNVPVSGTSCTGVAGSIGNYSNSHSIPDVAASFPVGVSTPNIITPNLNNLQGIFTASSNVVTITISGGNIQKGQWIVVNASNVNITITGDIKYTNGQLHGIADIPQVVIIANNINIADNVTNIDAWLIAKTSINTCSSSAPPLTINMCNQPLTVNGPVMTGKLYLRRTAGSGLGAATSPDHVEHSGDPAEVFNLRPDAYLWAAARTQSTGRVQTVYTTELPPRF